MNSLKIVLKGIFFLSIFFLVACKAPEFDDKKELLEYLQDESNGYSKRKEVNGVVFELTNRPSDLLIAQELESYEPDSSKRRIKEKYTGKLYFNLSISKNNKELLNSFQNSNKSFSELVRELSFEMGSKLRLLTEKRDTIEMIDYVYPRMYSLTNSTTLMVVFPVNESVKSSADVKLVFDDIGFNTGKVSFIFNTKKLLNPPELSEF